MGGQCRGALCVCLLGGGINWLRWGVEDDPAAKVGDGILLWGGVYARTSWAAETCEEKEVDKRFGCQHCAELEHSICQVGSSTLDHMIYTI